MRKKTIFRLNKKAQAFSLLESIISLSLLLIFSGGSIFFFRVCQESVSKSLEENNRNVLLVNTDCEIRNFISSVKLDFWNSEVCFSYNENELCVKESKSSQAERKIILDEKIKIISCRNIKEKGKTAFVEVSYKIKDRTYKVTEHIGSW